MSSSLLCVRLHELLPRLSRNISSHQNLRHFARSCVFSDADDGSRGSWYKAPHQRNSAGKHRRSENSERNESAFESSDSRSSFADRRGRFTRPEASTDDDRMSERPRYRKSFESSRESFADDEPNFWPTQTRQTAMNSSQEKFSTDADNQRRGSWYKSSDKRESSGRQRRSENSTPDESGFESESSDFGSTFTDKRARITRPMAPMDDSRMSGKPRFRKNLESSRESFPDEEPGFWPTQTRERRTNSSQETFSTGNRNFRQTERKPAVDRDVRSGNFVADRPTKNYNYGLTGLGKELPQKLIAAPPVKGEILYGIHSALLALLAGRREFHKFYIRDSLVDSEKPALQQIMSLVREKEVDFKACNKSLLTSLSQARPHQGVCLDAGPLDYEPLSSDESIFEDSANDALEPRLFVVLDSVQDPMNLGAVIRSSYFLGVDRLFVVKDNSKSSAGAMEIEKIFAIPDLVEFLEDFKERGWNLLGTTSSTKSNPDQVVSLKDISLKRNTILILGNEGSGLKADAEARCHQLVTIPPGRNLHPLVDCLNVSVATGIILHHLCRFKKFPKKEA